MPSVRPPQTPGWAPSGLNVELVDVASEALSVGDLCYWDTTQLAARAVSKMTDLGSAIAMQAAVAQVFLGVSNGQRLRECAQRFLKSSVSVASIIPQLSILLPCARISICGYFPPESPSFFKR